MTRGSRSLKRNRVTMTSSWRWDSDEEFEEYVQPHAINPVRHVRHSYTILSLAQCARELYENLANLRQALEQFETLLEQEPTPDAMEQARTLAIEICHFGESVLVFQKRLVLDMHAYGFVHGKDAIPHAAHQTHRPPTLYDLRQLAEDTRELLDGFEEMARADADFLVSGLRLPDSLLRDFRLARDLFSVGLDEIGLLVAGRGLEGVVRAILAERRISTPRAKPAAEAHLNEMIDILRQLRWKADKKPFLPRGAAEILHWLRETRNIGAHPQVDEGHPLGPPRELALLVTQAAQRLWQLHTSKRRRHLVLASP